MKVLAAIANYGTKNDLHLARVLDEYRAMRDDVDIVVTSDVFKNLGPDVEVVPGLPSKDPRSLPFAHKRIFADRCSAYDLFVYAEDDNLITQQNIDGFLRATGALDRNELAGFLRTEVDTGGKLYFSEPHGHFHWDAASVCRRGEFTFAYYTNDHSGCYILTREHLRQAIASGHFLVPFYHETYPPLETAATDPYTQCGFRKMICISQLERFLVPHLSNNYAGTSAQPAEEFFKQLKALEQAGKNERPTTTLFSVKTKLFHCHWSKSYYEPVQETLLSLVPAGARTVLSIGCGWGATERRLVERGIEVTAVPMDSVIAASAEGRGVEVVCGDFATVCDRLKERRFDCLMLSNVLHLVRDPVRLLADLKELLSTTGSIVASAPNVPWPRRTSRRIRFHGHTANPSTYEVSGMHISTGRTVRRWFRQAGLEPIETCYNLTGGKRRIDRWSLGLAKPLLGSDLYVSGVRSRTSG